MATCVLKFNELSKCRYFVEGSVFLVFSVLISRLGVVNDTSLLIPKIYRAPFDGQLKLDRGFYLLQGVATGSGALKRFIKLSSIPSGNKNVVDPSYPVTIFSDDPFLSMFDATFALDIHDPHSWRLSIIQNELRRRKIISNDGAYKLSVTISDDWTYTIAYGDSVVVVFDAEKRKMEIYDHDLTACMKQSFTRSDRHSLTALAEVNLPDLVSSSEGRVVIQC